MHVTHTMRATVIVESGWYRGYYFVPSQGRSFFVAFYDWLETHIRWYLMNDGFIVVNLVPLRDEPSESVSA